MAVTPHCEACKCPRIRCVDPNAHRKVTAWLADWKPSRKERRIREMFGSELDNPKQLADDALAAWKTDRKRGALQFLKQTATLFGTLVDQYWAEHAVVNSHDPQTSTFYTVELWKKWVGVDRKVSPLSEEELKQFQFDMRKLQRTLAAEGLAGATINRYFNIGRSIMERGREWGLVKVNPLEFVAKLQEDEPALRFLEQPEIDKLFNAARNLKEWNGVPATPERIKRVLQFMELISHTGARPSSIERCDFDNGDVDLNNMVVWFTTYKGGKHQKKHRYPVPIDKETLAIIVERKTVTGGKGRVFDCKDIYKLCTLVINQSGVNEGKPEDKHFTMYGLKHCLASHLRMSGASESEIAELLGHTDTRMLKKHYGHFTIDHLRKVQSRVNLSEPVKLKVV